MGRRGPKQSDPPAKRRCVHLTDAQCKLLRMWGRGCMSAGLRWLIDTAAPMIGKKLKESEKGG